MNSRCCSIRPNVGFVALWNSTICGTAEKRDRLCWIQPSQLGASDSFEFWGPPHSMFDPAPAHYSASTRSIIRQSHSVSI